METNTTLVTVEEFRLMTDPPGCRLQLRNGKVIPFRIETHGHAKVRKRLASLLDAALGATGEPGVYFGLRTLQSMIFVLPTLHGFRRNGWMGSMMRITRGGCF